MSEFIESIESVNTGGGTMVDFIRLKNGQIITLSEDMAVLHDTEDDFWAPDHNKQYDVLNINSYGWKE